MYDGGLINMCNFINIILFIILELLHRFKIDRL
jgi:hypothetical protein